MIEEKELREIKNRAKEMARIEGQNPLWTRAWERLEDAASGLESLMRANVIYGEEK